MYSENSDIWTSVILFLICLIYYVQICSIILLIWTTNYFMFMWSAILGRFKGYNIGVCASPDLLDSTVPFFKQVFYAL